MGKLQSIKKSLGLDEEIATNIKRMEKEYKSLIRLIQLKSKDYKYFEKENDGIRCYHISLIEYLHKQLTGEECKFTITPQYKTIEDDGVLTEIQETNKYYPVQDWATNLTWDGVDRYSDLAKALHQDPDSNEWKLVLEWFKGSMNRFLHPGTKHDLILTLHGGQGYGKSTTAKYLSISCDEVHSIENKDDVLQMHRHNILELAELDGITTRNEAAALKAFITKDSDTVRPPYRDLNDFDNQNKVKYFC